MSFSAQLRSDVETLDVTINNYERMENAPEAWSRIKVILAEVQKPSYNSDKTICPECGGEGFVCSQIADSAYEGCSRCKGTGHIV